MGWANELRRCLRLQQERFGLAAVSLQTDFMLARTSFPITYVKRAGKKQMSKSHANPARSNQLLGAMEPAALKRIAPYLEPITSNLGAVVCEAGGILRHAYFPRGSVLSLLTVLENGSAIETANIGRGGGIGLFAAMYSRVSFNRCIVQLEGHMVRCPIELLQTEFQNSDH